MFIDCAKLEKILKADYKSWGVKFGLTEKGMYILNGTGWMVEADKTKITKEFLGTVIKTCGLAPEKGEFMTYQKGHDPQFETEREPSCGIWQRTRRKPLFHQLKSCRTIT